MLVCCADVRPATKSFARQVGRDYFRIHPKGIGMMCVRSSGLPPLSFVSEYLGEMYSPARWCDTQWAPAANLLRS